VLATLSLGTVAGLDLDGGKPNVKTMN